MTAGLPLMKSVLTYLSKIVLLLFGLSAVMSATDAAIQRKIYGSGCPSVVVFANNLSHNSLMPFFTLINNLLIGNIASFKFITQRHFFYTF